MLLGNLPLYIQIKNEIEYNILNTLNANERIPSEHTLMETYGVSRTTIRKAIDILEQEGLVYKKHGIGTFVSEEKVQQEIANYAGFSRQMKSQGFDVKYHTINKEIIQSDKLLANKLKISENEKIFYLQRRVRRDKEIINNTKSFIPYKYVKGIEEYNFEENSLYHILEKEFGLKVTIMTRGIKAIIANHDIAQILEISEGVPLLEFEGLVTAETDTSETILIEYFQTFYRTDYTQFLITQKVE